MPLNKPFYDIRPAFKYFDSLYGCESEEQKERYFNLFNRFKKEFNSESGYIASSSGRVEICGNHTDHNGGRVICCAVSLDTLAVFLPTEDGTINIKSEGYPEISLKIDGLDSVSKGTSAAMTAGVVRGFLDRGYKVGGFNACITSNVPGGAGISSSASFELLIAEILNFLYNDGCVDNEEKAVIARFSENEYFGKPCGLLDQSAISFGGLRLFDFSDKNKIAVKEICNRLSGYNLVLINTGGSHENLTDEYASIPRDMSLVARAMGGERLIDISESDFYKKLPGIKGKVSDRAICRAIHFYDENKRVDRVYGALNNNDYEDFLLAIKESGISSLNKLQNCCLPGSESEPIPLALFLTERFLHGGANRVHGGGFAGTILNIVKNEFLDEFISGASKYFGKGDITPLKVRSCGAIVLK